MTLHASLHSEIRQLAEAQHGVVDRDQVLAAGGTPSFVQRLRGSVEWEAVGLRVLRLTGSPPTRAQELMAAVLDAGPAAFLSGVTAAGWWGVPGFEQKQGAVLHVTRPRGRTRRPSSLGQVHEVLDLLPHHVTRLDGIPLSVPTRTVFEVAAAVHPERADRACDTFLSMRLTTVPRLHRMLDDWADHGRKGTVSMREILEKRAVGYVPPASNLERRFMDVIADLAVGPYDRQIDLGGETWIGRVDFKHRTLPLVVEILSDRYHRGLLDQQADEARFAALRRAGFSVLPVWDLDVWHEPRTVTQRVFAAERAARTRAAA